MVYDNVSTDSESLFSSHSKFKYFTRDAFIIVNARRVILIIPVVCVIYPTSPIFTVNFLICQELQNPLTPLFKVVACILFYRY